MSSSKTDKKTAPATSAVRAPVAAAPPALPQAPPASSDVETPARFTLRSLLNEARTAVREDALEELYGTWSAPGSIVAVGHGTPAHSAFTDVHVAFVLGGAAVHLGKALAALRRALRDTFDRDMQPTEDDDTLRHALDAVNTSVSAAGAAMGRQESAVAKPLTMAHCAAVYGQWVKFRNVDAVTFADVAPGVKSYWGSARQLLTSWVAHALAPAKLTHPLSAALLAPMAGLYGAPRAARTWPIYWWWQRTPSLAWHTALHAGAGLVKDVFDIGPGRQYLPGGRSALTWLTPGGRMACAAAARGDGKEPHWRGQSHMWFWYSVVRTEAAGGDLDVRMPASHASAAAAAASASSRGKARPGARSAKRGPSPGGAARAKSPAAAAGAATQGFE